MSRPVSEEKRKALMEAAIDLFSIQGFHATPTQQISDRAGVSAGTLFRYFRTKEDLIDALYASIHQALADVVNEAIRPGTPVEEQIKNVKRQVLHWMFEHPKQALFFERFDSSPNIKNKAKETISSHLSALDELYQRGISWGILTGIDREVFLANFWCPNFMLIHLYLFGRLQSGIDDIIEQAVASMWSGMAQREEDCRVRQGI